jgi:alpha-amylase
MTDVVFYFQVHQPFRLRHGPRAASGDPFDDQENERILRRVAGKCYLPMTALLLRLVEQHEGAFRCAFSISGTALDQLERWTPEVLDSFVRLAGTGCVEFLAETSHHSLAALFDPSEFTAQVEAHAARVARLFGARPTTFRNTELIVDNAIARRAEELGFTAILGEGADRLLGTRSPRALYRPRGCQRIKLLLRSYALADDIAFRFSNRAWSGWPLTAEKWVAALRQLPEADGVVNLFMDFETFGEHQWADSGIFEFMRELPSAVRREQRFLFRTPAEVAAAREPAATLDIQSPVSWADVERDLTAWLGNLMQRTAGRALHAAGGRVRAAGRRRPGLLEQWRRLTTSDHLYYMCTKWFADGDVHKYFSPFESPHAAFVTFMDALDGLLRRVTLRARRRAVASRAARGK